jgi:L-2-hydroxycarboxylate dehydrogenase (NAD+)
VVIDFARELRLVADVLASHGVAAGPAALQSEWLAEADLRGHPSHGIQRLPMIVARIREGLIDPRAKPSIDWTRDAYAVIDGDRGIGPLVGTKAIDAAAARAARTGVAVAAVHNANHLGMLAPYVERAIERAGVVAIAMTTSEALVHPWNGTTAMLGTNPIAIGIPTDPPVLLDMATSAVSMGRILSHRHRSTPLDSGWAIDADGRGTLDPEQAQAISPFGGAKGYGLALAIELIVGALTGSALGQRVTGTLDSTSVCNKGDVFIAVDTAALGADTTARLERYLSELRDSRALDGTRGVTIPGDRARSRRQYNMDHGIEIPDSVWEQIVDLYPAAEKVG